MLGWEWNATVAFLFPPPPSLPHSSLLPLLHSLLFVPTFSLISSLFSLLSSVSSSPFFLFNIFFFLFPPSLCASVCLSPVSPHLSQSAPHSLEVCLAFLSIPEITPVCLPEHESQPKPLVDQQGPCTAQSKGEKRWAGPCGVELSHLLLSGVPHS